jgi:hypothetical protein
MILMAEMELIRVERKFVKVLGVGIDNDDEGLK